ncbi:major histocompatibility complex class I-related gene protein-like [Cyprinus carpio]|uniref:Major histocompatibility complex class I-related gene protein-like n=1 Tax=Cyprinus carpio TaxID=7962 RepID=A0A9Q9V457_CYPCA|nr:major histocompatibility complex class I-related gene protein-like [Cyprinus carpio]
MNKVLPLFLLLLPIIASKGSHSLWFIATYIKGQTPFPEFSYVAMLDDVRVLYYNGETKTLHPRGNTTTEDMFDSEFLTISDVIHADLKLTRWIVARTNLNETDRVVTLQRLVGCELRDDGEPGQMITRDAVRGSTTDELLYVDNNFTYQGTLDVPAPVLKTHLEIGKKKHEYLYRPYCIKTLKGYLEKRKNQVNRKVKPRLRLIQKALTDSGGSRVSCLATGFYPRHINLTLFRDEQPVADHEITAGDLLPNDDGTYQMRKSLEISAADKHTYTCSVTHLSLDNKLDVTLEFEHGEPFKSVLPLVLIVLALVLVFGAAAAITARKRRCADSIKNGYSSASTSEENMDKKSELRCHDTK